MITQQPLVSPEADQQSLETHVQTLERLLRSERTSHVRELQVVRLVALLRSVTLAHPEAAKAIVAELDTIAGDIAAVLSLHPLPSVSPLHTRSQSRPLSPSSPPFDPGTVADRPDAASLSTEGGLA
jgi:hypothetical protein